MLLGTILQFLAFSSVYIAGAEKCFRLLTSHTDLTVNFPCSHSHRLLPYLHVLVSFPMEVMGIFENVHVMDFKINAQFPFLLHILFCSLSMATSSRRGLKHLYGPQTFVAILLAVNSQLVASLHPEET